MAELSRDTVRLLDRLFNLRGLENVIVKGIEEEIRRNAELTESELSKKTQNEVAKVDCEGRLLIFETQKGIFENAFAGLDNETFSALRDIDVNIEIGTMLEIIANRAPKFSADLNAQIVRYQEDIDNNKARIDELHSELAELEESKKSSIEDREKLISLFEQCLSSDEMERESLSTSYVKRILGLFGLFSSEEINTLAKLIIFPEDGLYSYAETYEERLNSGLIDLDSDEVDEVKEDAVELGQVDEEEQVQVEAEEPVVAEEPAELEESVEQTDEKSDEFSLDADHQDIVPAETAGLMNEETSLIDLSSLNADIRPLDEDTAEKEEEKVATPVEPETQEIKGVSIVGDTIELSSDKTDDEQKELNPFADNIVPERATDEESVPDEKEEVADEKDQSDSKVGKFLKSIGLTEENFVNFNGQIDIESIYSLFAEVPEKVIEENYELLRSLNVSTEAIYTCWSVDGELKSYLSDRDLSKKVTYLRAKAISEKTIKELLEDSKSGLRESYMTVEEKIGAIEKSVGKLDDENVSLIGTDIVLFNRNCQELSSFGIELEEQELRNNRGILTASTNVPGDLKVLKNYLISLVRKNGKYALTPFWKNPYELLTDIDSLIEAGLVGLIQYDPQALGLSAAEIVKRSLKVKANGATITEDDYENIMDYVSFDKANGKAESLAGTRDGVNRCLPELIGNEDFVKILTSILDDYYRESEDIVEVDLDNETQERLEELKSQLTDKLNATVTGVYTYEVASTTISKNKVDRQLGVLLNALVSSGQQIEGVEREVLLTAIMYNLCCGYEQLQEIVNAGLGFNVNLKTLGGNNL